MPLENYGAIQRAAAWAPASVPNAFQQGRQDAQQNALFNHDWAKQQQDDAEEQAWIAAINEGRQTGDYSKAFQIDPETTTAYAKSQLDYQNAQRPSVGQLYQVDQGGKPVYMPADQAAGQPAWAKPEAGGGGGFGNVNPGDYTPASLATFAKTGNYGDLVRQYAPPAPPAVVVRDIAGVPSVVAPTRGGQASVTPLTNINTVAGNAGTVAGAEKGAQAAAEQRAGVTKRATDATNSNEVLDLADTLVDASTGSLVGAAADRVANVFGYSPKGDEAIAGLKVLQAKLMMSMPRMEGPQSDKDVQLYREAAGSLGDPTVPRNKKKVAIATIRRLNAQYAGKGGAATSAPGMPPANRLKEGVVTHFANGQSWTLQNGQPVQVK